MKIAKTLAAAFLALGFAFVSYGLLVVEPKMGFTEFADFFDPKKVVAASDSLVWFIGDLVYLGFGVVLVFLALTTEDRLQHASGLVAGVGFFFIASLGQIMTSLPDFIDNVNHLETAVLGTMPIRFAALKSTVLALGVFAWGTTRSQASEKTGSAAWRGFGYLTLAASIAFVLVFLPIPLLFAIWSGWLALRLGRGS